MAAKATFKRSEKQSVYFNGLKDRFLKHRESVSKLAETLKDPSITPPTFYDNALQFTALDGGSCESLEGLLRSYKESNGIEPSNIDFEILTVHELRSATTKNLCSILSELSDEITRAKEVSTLYSYTEADPNSEFPRMHSIFVRQYTMDSSPGLYIFYDFTQLKTSKRLVIMTHNTLCGIYRAIKLYITQSPKYDPTRKHLTCFFILKYKQQYNSLMQENPMQASLKGAVNLSNNLFPNQERLEHVWSI